MESAVLVIGAWVVAQISWKGSSGNRLFCCCLWRTACLCLSILYKTNVWLMTLLLSAKSMLVQNEFCIQMGRAAMRSISGLVNCEGQSHKAVSRNHNWKSIFQCLCSYSSIGLSFHGLWGLFWETVHAHVASRSNCQTCLTIHELKFILCQLNFILRCC